MGLPGQEAEINEIAERIRHRQYLRRYAAGLSARDIRAHLEEVYGLKVSVDLVSHVSDDVVARTQVVLVIGCSTSDLDT